MSKTKLSFKANSDRPLELFADFVDYLTNDLQLLAHTIDGLDEAVELLCLTSVWQVGCRWSVRGAGHAKGRQSTGEQEDKVYGWGARRIWSNSRSVMTRMPCLRQYACT